MKIVLTMRHKPQSQCCSCCISLMFVTSPLCYVSCNQHPIYTSRPGVNFSAYYIEPLQKSPCILCHLLLYYCLSQVQVQTSLLLQTFLLLYSGVSLICWSPFQEQWFTGQWKITEWSNFRDFWCNSQYRVRVRNDKVVLPPGSPSRFATRIP